MSWFIVGRLCLNVTVDKMISVSNISITMEEIAKTVRGRNAEKFEMTKCEFSKETFRHSPQRTLTFDNY